MNNNDYSNCRDGTSYIVIYRIIHNSGITNYIRCRVSNLVYKTLKHQT